MYIFIDFETRSMIDLLEVDADFYARNESTHPLILCSDVGDPVTIFDNPPEWWDTSKIFVAHNAYFERAIIRHCLPHWPFPPHWLDTAAMSRRAGLPGSLDGATIALDLSNQKDKRGKALINVFCKPQKPTKKSGQSEPYFIEPHDKPAEFAEFIAYCQQDVYAEKELYERIGPEISRPLRCLIRRV